MPRQQVPTEPGPDSDSDSASAPDPDPEPDREPDPNYATLLFITLNFVILVVNVFVACVVCNSVRHEGAHCKWVCQCVCVCVRHAPRLLATLGLRPPAFYPLELDSSAAALYAHGVFIKVVFILRDIFGASFALFL